MRAIARAQSDSRTQRSGIPLAALLAGGAPGPRTGAGAALALIAAGLQECGWPEPDVCPLTPGGEGTRELLDAQDFETRMRRARALVVLAERLAPSTLAGSITFEMATMARQGGVPAYAVTGESDLDLFGARILDLQLIIQARSPAALRAAGRTLGEVL